VEARLTVDGGLTIRPATWNLKAFVRELAAGRKATFVQDAVRSQVERSERP